MTIQRISTFAMHQNTMRDASSVMSELAVSQKQLSSGFKADLFSGLNGQVEQFTALDAKIRKTTNYIENNSVTLSRLNTTQVNIEKIYQVADDMENLITLRRNPGSANNLNFTQRMEALRTSATSMLNSTFEGRYIFGGTRTDVPPVIEPIPNPVEVGVPDDSYYQGSKENVSARVQDNAEIEYNVRADDSGFQKMYAAVEFAIKGHTENNDETIGKALTMMQEGMSEINATQTVVNSNIVTVTNINERHNDLKLYWKGVQEEINKTDIVSTTTKVSYDQAVLQATFQAFSSINRMRLADFLR